MKKLMRRTKAEIGSTGVDPMFMTLFRYSPVAMELYDREGILIHVNAAHKKLWNVSAESLVGNYNVLTDEKIRGTVLHDCISRAYREGVSVSAKHDFTLPLLSSISSPKILRSRVCPVKDEKDQVSFVFIIHEDVGEILGIRDELIRVKREADNADLIRTTFLKNLSHELKTPLHWISGMSDMLQEGQSAEMIMELSGAINESVVSLLSVIDRLINISLLEADEIPLEFSHFHLGTMLEELKLEYEERYKKKERDLDIVVKEELTSSTDEIFSDRAHVWQVLTSLIDNALGSEGRNAVELGCKRTAEQRFLIYVRNKGASPTAGRKENLFNKFRDEDNEGTRNYDSTGLGLSYAKGLIEKLSGFIWFDAGDDEDPTIFFELPAGVQKQVIA